MKSFISYFHLVCCFVCLSATISSYAQADITAEKLLKHVLNYNVFSRIYPQEKVYLHTDNTVYYLGETIWFKAYVVEAEMRQATDMSKVLYAELLTPEGNLVEMKKLKIENGQCHGDFRLKDSMALYAGYYEIRAYTRYMLNFDDSFIFSRVFPVYDRPAKAGEYQQNMTRSPRKIPAKRQPYKSEKNISISFFPEGGHLIAGINNRVAFKVIEKNGEVVDAGGVLYDSHGNAVTTFAVLYNGMGSFEFVPGKEKYFAKINYENREYSFELPAALSLGCAIQVDNLNSNRLFINIEKSPRLKSDTLGICISCYGKLCFFETIAFRDSQNSQRLVCSKDNLSAGVNEITLFDKNGNIVSQRLFFVRKTDEAVSIRCRQDKELQRPFEKINIDFELRDEKNRPIETTFSVSVRDTETSPLTPYSENILSNLLLSSEIKGFIKHPAFYFESDSYFHRKALDLLLMVQGWSRYKWEQMINPSVFQPKHPLEKQLAVRGRILTKSKNPDIGRTVRFQLSYDEKTQEGLAVTDSLGRFTVNLLDYEGRHLLFVEPLFKKKARDNYITLDRLFSPIPKTYTFAELTGTEFTLEEIPDTAILLASDTTVINKKLSMEERMHILDAVTVKERRKYSYVRDLYDNAFIIYDVERVIDEIRDNANTAPDTYTEFLWEVNPQYAELGIYGFLRIGNRKFYPEKKILRTIDGIEYFVITPSYFGRSPVYMLYGDNPPFGGVKEARRGTRLTKFEGYARGREFYNPDYNNMDIALLTYEEDYRRTLHWNPNVRTDSEGKASISFYNNSACKNIHISAEGITKNGTPVVYERK